jgi:UDP-N-acetylglucosamine:LPS N-acetylglucosamine transferase
LNNILVIASAGGHLTQALAATGMICNRIVATNKTGIAKLNIDEHEVLTRDTTRNIWIHFLNFLTAINVFYLFKIDGVFCSGGPMALPFLLLAKLLRIKIYYLDTMSRMEDLSNTGKLVYKLKLYDKFVVQWPNLQKQYEKAECYGSIFNINYSRDT